MMYFELENFFQILVSYFTDYYSIIKYFDCSIIFIVMVIVIIIININYQFKKNY